MSDIKYAYPLILNKVASPQYATPVLRRARLLDWLTDAANCRATVIAADAGYGKTTLLWQWEREAPFPCYWYKLDRTDRDWTFHISYLIEAISKRHKGFGRRAHSMLQQMGGPGSSRPGVAGYLLAEMHQRLTEPCTFIIDDWQYVNAVTEVRGLWNQILRDAPSTCRFIFASRSKPRLQFARFKTHGGYAELVTDALRFTPPEISELFRDIYNDPLQASELAELDQRTEGWAASLQLVEVSLRERSTSEAREGFIQTITATSDSDLFDFLAEEVLDQQPEETRNFLMSTSILQQITPEVAERLTGVHDGRRELRELEQRGLFTNRLDEVRFRYHTLFREFLERRLIADRSESEVVGLHIHAASYFETAEQWPDAIHHYLRAGLQRQAARLISKYGEDVIAAGGLGLVDEWLLELPEEATRQNARLNLLLGEARGVRGDWEGAVDSLERARGYFAKKGDRRMEALSCLKLSTVHLNNGDVAKSARVAEDGLTLAPESAVATRLRLRGNLTVTRTWIREPMTAVVAECERIAAEAEALGLEHFAAIGYHNAGDALLRMGRTKSAITNLERAARCWSEPPTSPFADNALLVLALLADGRADRARSVATEAVRRTEPWPRPNKHARHGLAAVLAYEGRLDRAMTVLEDIRRDQAVVGLIRSLISAQLIEYMYLSDTRSSELTVIADDLAGQLDTRFATDLAPARAIATHLSGHCKGECQASLRELDEAEVRGESRAVIIARLKIGALAHDHGIRRYRRAAWKAANEVVDGGHDLFAREWLRRFTTQAALKDVITADHVVDLVSRLARLDPEGWRGAVVWVLSKLEPGRRAAVMETVLQVANRDTTKRLREIGGHDVAEARRRLQSAQAARLYVRTFGSIAVHRGGWNGPAITIDKKRVRALLGVLAAHAREPLTRDGAIDLLWPDADGDAAVNSLNQTVYQLRRHLDPSYRGGDSAEYVISTSDHVALNHELVHTDLNELGRLAHRLEDGTWSDRHALAGRLLDLVGGEFLGDLRYEDWVSRTQLAVHTEVRALLLPIAQSTRGQFDPNTSTRAASVLLRFDPYDEAAILALASGMAASGQRIAARALVFDHAQRVRREFDDEPSAEFVAAAEAIAPGWHVKLRLTQPASRP